MRKKIELRIMSRRIESTSFKEYVLHKYDSRKKDGFGFDNRILCTFGTNSYEVLRIVGITTTSSVCFIGR